MIHLQRKVRWQGVGWWGIKGWRLLMTAQLQRLTREETILACWCLLTFAGWKLLHLGRWWPLKIAVTTSIKQLFLVTFAVTTRGCTALTDWKNGHGIRFAAVYGQLMHRLVEAATGHQVEWWGAVLEGSLSFLMFIFIYFRGDWQIVRMIVTQTWCTNKKSIALTICSLICAAVLLLIDSPNLVCFILKVFGRGDDKWGLRLVKRV